MSNAIVQYVPNTGLDISRCMVELAPLAALNLETRIVVDGHMFAGGFRGLEFDPRFVKGIAYLRLFEELKEEAGKEPSFSSRVLTKLFGENAPQFDIEHNGKRYNKKWGVTTSPYYDSWNRREETSIILLYSRYEGRLELYENLLGKLKTNVAHQANVLVSNELLSRIFNPLVPPLTEVYHRLGRF